MAGSIPQDLRVLTYHRVADPGGGPHLEPRLISAAPAEFERQMRYLARRYRAVSPARVLEAVDGVRPLPRRAVLISFDDGYLDFAEHAWPVLQRLGLPAVLFVPSAFPDHPEQRFWSDRLHGAFAATGLAALAESPVGPLPLASADQRRSGLRKLQDHLKSVPHDEAAAWVERVCAALGPESAPRPVVLGWGRLRRLAQEGLTVASHTRTHPILTRLDAERAGREIAAGQADLEREMGHAPPFFAYPSGAHDDAVVAETHKAGIRLAFTTIDGHNRLPGTDPLRLHRTSITTRTRGLAFKLRLHRWAARVDAWRHR